MTTQSEIRKLLVESRRCARLALFFSTDVRHRDLARATEESVRAERFAAKATEAIRHRRALLAQPHNPRNKTSGHS